jgi:hypothetical protein
MPFVHLAVVLVVVAVPTGQGMQDPATHRVGDLA